MPAVIDTYEEHKSLKNPQVGFQVVLVISNLLLMFLIFTSSVLAQNQESRKSQAEKFSEFGSAGECELRRNLDEFLIHLMNRTKAKGVIIYYQGKDVLPAYYESPMPSVYKNHLKFRNFDEKRVDIINAGFREHQTTEMWIVPDGAENPKPSKTIPPPQTPKNKTFLYDRQYLEATEFFLPQPEEVGEETITQEIKTNSLDDSISDEELKEWSFFWTKYNFAKKIKEQKGARGVILYYADDEYHDLNKLQSHLIEGIRRLTSKGKVGFERIDLIYGGFRGGVEVEFWIVPKNGQMPVLMPDKREPEETEN